MSHQTIQITVTTLVICVGFGAIKGIWRATVRVYTAAIFFMAGLFGGDLAGFGVVALLVVPNRVTHIPTQGHVLWLVDHPFICQLICLVTAWSVFTGHPWGWLWRPPTASRRS